MLLRYQVHIADAPLHEGVVLEPLNGFHIVRCGTGVQNVKIHKVIMRILLNLVDNKGALNRQ